MSDPAHAQEHVRAIARARFDAQLLSGTPATSAVDVVERILAVQGQDPRGARLAVRARSVGLLATDVDRALTDDRSLVISWLNRGTLHLVRGEDFHWLHALTAQRLAAWNETRLREENVAPQAVAAALATIRKALASEGPLTREQLRERLSAAGLDTRAQPFMHYLMTASIRGLIVRGPMRGAEHCFVLVRDWLGDPPPVDREIALAWLARRYLAGHGPATDRDLVKWSGLSVRESRTGFRAISSELIEEPDGLVDLRGRSTPSELPPPRLLGQFDPVLHGWASREFVVDGHNEIITMNGIFKAFALVDGVATGTWSLPNGRVRLEPFRALDQAEAAALEADGRDVLRYLGKPNPRPDS